MRKLILVLIGVSLMSAVASSPAAASQHQPRNAPVHDVQKFRNSNNAYPAPSVPVWQDDSRHAWQYDPRLSGGWSAPAGR